MNTIKSIRAREILDSRAKPTIEVDISLKENNGFGRASVPSGASVGSKEAHELRDGGRRYHGFGVLNAVKNVNDIVASHCIGKSFANQKALDEMLIKIDGTPDKSNLGANTLLAVSMAFAKAQANAHNMELFEYIGSIYNPQNCNYMTNLNHLLPMINIVNGGKHADNGLDLQEFMIIPIVGDSIKDRIRIASEVFYSLRNELKILGLSTNVGDEGGFAPHISSSEDALHIISSAILSAGYGFDEVKLAIDAAASDFYKGDDLYVMKGNKDFSSSQLITYYKTLMKKYPIISIEDPLAENDFDGWKQITANMKCDIQLVGDDIFVTNEKMLQEGISSNIANAVIIKPNQVGTLSETIDTVKLATSNGYKTIISHRSGETEDVSIAHLAVAFGSTYIKAGSVSRTDRTAKYNELLRIYDKLLIER